MGEPGGHPDLVLEASLQPPSLDGAVHQPERHQAVVPQVAREVDRGHAPAARLAVNGIAVAEARLEVGGQVRHAGAMKGFP